MVPKKFKPAPTGNLPRVTVGQDLTPATPAQMEQARAIEAARKRYDKSYISAAEAAAIPQEVVDAKPELASRIRYSQPDWPENKASATEALGELPGGEGQTVERRELTFDELGQGPVNVLKR